MGKPLSTLGIVALMCAALCSAPAFAELNLWVSYHYAGEDSYSAADYADAEQLLLEAGPESRYDHRDAYALNALGMTYAARGSFDAAEKCYLCALRLLEKSMGKRSRDIPMVLNNLADLYFIAGDADRSEPLFRRALDINERDQRNIEVCRSLNGMALLHNSRGEIVQAEKLLLRAIKIHEASKRREHPHLATALVNLAVMYMNEGKCCCKVEALLDRAAFIQGRSLKPCHPDVAIRLHVLAGLLVKTERIDEAREVQARAEALQKKQADKNPLTPAGEAPICQ
ncbi:MAG: tetratricopeptide repeat protein [bacterium]|nr:tetratricopeptide repeat protein [bacterium]